MSSCVWKQYKKINYNTKKIEVSGDSIYLK